MKIVSFTALLGLLTACGGDHIKAKRAGLVREQENVVGTFGFEDIRPEYQEERPRD
jgi:hypothetical protein